MHDLNSASMTFVIMKRHFANNGDKQQKTFNANSKGAYMYQHALEHRLVDVETWCQSFGDVSPYVCLYYFSSVWVAEWSPFGK